MDSQDTPSWVIESFLINELLWTHLGLVTRNKSIYEICEARVATKRHRFCHCSSGHVCLERSHSSAIQEH